MKIEKSVAFVTGANRGIGRAFVDDLLKRGVSKIYLASRDIASLAPLLERGDNRLVPIKLDVTDETQIADAAKVASDVTLLINNAGYSGDGSAFTTLDLKAARREMDVNYFGVLSLVHAFAPALKASGGGAVVNVLSILSLVTIPAVGTYSASKSAALAATRSLRAELAAQSTTVVGVMPVQVETDMGQVMPEPRLTPQEVAAEALDGVEAGVEDVFPGQLTRIAMQSFTDDPKGFQQYLSTLLPAVAGAA